MRVTQVMEIMAIGSNSLRYALWIFCIGLLNYITLFIIPAALIQKAVGSLRRRMNLVVFVTVYGIYLLFLVYYLMLEKAALEKDENTLLVMHIGGVFSTAVQFNCISKIGVGIISALSGFSIVYMPFEFFRYYNPLITKINKSNIEEELNSHLEQIRKEKIKLARLALESETLEPGEAAGGLLGGVFKGLFGKRLNKFEKQLESLKKSVKLSQQNLNSLFIDYAEICKEEKNFELAQTNRLWSCLERSLSIMLLVYGTYKVITTAAYLMLGRNQPSDPITTTLAYLSR